LPIVFNPDSVGAAFSPDPVGIVFNSDPVGAASDPRSFLLGAPPLVCKGGSFSSPRIPELDGLRGLAILLVILCHYVGNADHMPLGFWPHRILSAFTAGWSGVDLFFVLSGFLIGGILLDARTSSNYFRAFYMRRVYRILPIYYLWTLLFAVIVIAAITFSPGRLPVTVRDLLRIPVQLFFLQNIFIGMPDFQWTWFVVTWSLAVEEQFYLLAPPLIRFVSLRKVAAVLALSIGVAPLLRFLFFRYWSPSSYLAAFLMPCRADGLACGMLIAFAWRQPGFHLWLRRHRSALQWATLILLLDIAALLWWFVHPPNIVTVTLGYSWLALFYSAFLVLVLSQTASWPAAIMRCKPLAWLGTISYCVYILHDAFNFLAHRLVLHSTPRIYDAPGVAVSLLAFAATIAVATLSWRFFEKPLIRRGHSYSYSESAV
jgi:peptidoglycan/LPS O-acetylase OafA/YrhL